MLNVFAEVVRTADLGPVADLGCGPGKVTAYLAERQVPAFGVDGSPAMVELARSAYPGSPLQRRLDDLAPDRGRRPRGLLAYYSTHHTPPTLLPVVFGESTALSHLAAV